MRRPILAFCFLLAFLLSGLACSGDQSGLAGIWTGTFMNDKSRTEVEFRFRNDGRLEVVQTSDDITRTQIGEYELKGSKIIFTPDRVKVSNLTPEQNADLSESVQKQKMSVTYMLTRKGPDEIAIELEKPNEALKDPISLKRKKD